MLKSDAEIAVSSESEVAVELVSEQVDGLFSWRCDCCCSCGESSGKRDSKDMRRAESFQ